MPFHVLVAEDDRVARTVLSTIVAAEPDFIVHAAEDGAEAWQWLNDPSRFFDAVFLDLQMPGMDGLELLAHLRSSPLLKGTKVVICTSSRETATFRRALELKVAEYLLKPVVGDRIRRILGKIRSAAPVASGQV
jgi:two-component system sensor histidine kinase EvgS